MHYFTDVIKKYAVFKGRASRKEYWMFVLSSLIIGIILGIILRIIKSIININLDFISQIFGLAILLPSIAVTARRFHDIGKSGLWYLIVLLNGFLFVLGLIFIFAIGPISFILWGTAFVLDLIVFIFLIRKGNIGENKYGPDPYNNVQLSPNTNPAPEITPNIGTQ